MVFPDDDPRPPTTNVLPELRDVTLVWTFTLPNAVTRHWGICSVKARRSSGEGLSWTVFASIRIGTVGFSWSLGSRPAPDDADARRRRGPPILPATHAAGTGPSRVSPRPAGAAARPGGPPPSPSARR